MGGVISEDGGTNEPSLGKNMGNGMATVEEGLGCEGGRVELTHG